MSYSTANAFTWTATVAEVLIGLWLIAYMGWPAIGGFVCGLAMGCQFARVVMPMSKQLGLD